MFRKNQVQLLVKSLKNTTLTKTVCNNLRIVKKITQTNFNSLYFIKRFHILVIGMVFAYKEVPRRIGRKGWCRR